MHVTTLCYSPLWLALSVWERIAASRTQPIRVIVKCVKLHRPIDWLIFHGNIIGTPSSKLDLMTWLRMRKKIWRIKEASISNFVQRFRDSVATIIRYKNPGHSSKHIFTIHLLLDVYLHDKLYGPSSIYPIEIIVVYYSWHIFIRWYQK
jgi:hypothetical protein